MVVGAFGKFAEAIRGDRSPAKAQGYLTPIDVAAMARQLNLDSIAAERGARDQPASNSQSLDVIEQQITQAIESEWTWHGGELINNLRAYAARLIEFSIQTELANIHLLARNTLTKLRDANHRAEAELGPLRETFVSFRDELRDFRAKHKLKRSARDPANRFTTLGLLFLLIGVEAAINGVFFAKGSEFGLVGGIVTAIGISFANVSVAFILGLVPMRWMNHRNYFVKLIGLSFTLAGLGSLVALHGFAAHYRDAIAAVGEDRALGAATATLLKTPFALGDLNSYYLFGIGIIWAIAAIWKGYNNDDPYPRYGAYYRRAALARNEYSDEHSALFDELNEIKEKTVAAIKAGTQRIPLFPQQAAQIRSERTGHLQAFGAYESSIQTAANQLLARYRDGNVARRNSPAPRHFDTSWNLPRSFLTDATVLTATSEPAVPPLDANAALDDLRNLGRTVLEEYENLLAKYPHPTQMQP
jgi:hypothetical protein